jgi:hypothetical protein
VNTVKTKSEAANTPAGRPGRGSIFRRGLMAMAAIAVFGYVVAFIQADRGATHYNAYVRTFGECVEARVDSAAVTIDCNQVPEVRGHLLAHREAIAVGDPFLNLALALTLAIVLLPLIRRCARWLRSRRDPGPERSDRTVQHPA